MKTAGLDLACYTNPESDLEKVKSFLKCGTLYSVIFAFKCVASLFYLKSLCNEDERDISDLFSDYKLAFLWKSTPQGI